MYSMSIEESIEDSPFFLCTALDWITFLCFVVSAFLFGTCCPPTPLLLSLSLSLLYLFFLSRNNHLFVRILSFSRTTHSINFYLTL